MLQSRRVVAKSVNPNITMVKEVMTPNPVSVSSEDSAMEALGIMLERHFRHLPVSITEGLVRAEMILNVCMSFVYHNNIVWCGLT